MHSNVLIPCMPAGQICVWSRKSSIESNWGGLNEGIFNQKKIQVCMFTAKKIGGYWVLPPLQNYQIPSTLPEMLVIHQCEFRGFFFPRATNFWCYASLVSGPIWHWDLKTRAYPTLNAGNAHTCPLMMQVSMGVVDRISSGESPGHLALILSSFVILNKIKP